MIRIAFYYLVLYNGNEEYTDKLKKEECVLRAKEKNNRKSNKKFDFFSD